MDNLSVCVRKGALATLVTLAPYCLAANLAKRTEYIAAAMKRKATPKRTMSSS